MEGEFPSARKLFLMREKNPADKGASALTVTAALSIIEAAVFEAVLEQKPSDPKSVEINGEYT
jgi:hypothetical protein